MTNSVTPCWYPDPHDPTQENWWDGTKYHGTRTVAANPATPPVPPVPPVPSVPAVPPVAAALPPTPPFPEASQPATVAYVVPPAVRIDPTGARISPKSRTVASILGFFFGGLGVDRFYLGNIGMGVAKLLVGWLTLGLWPLIDWIVIIAGAAHDGEGLPVTSWD